MAAFLDAHDRGERVAVATSGTAGRPRRVLRTTASWVDSFGHVAALTGCSARSRTWLPGPVSSSLTLFAATLARWQGGAVVDDLAAATHAHLTPGHLAEALQRHPEAAAWEGTVLVVAGDALPAAVAAEAGSRGAVIHRYYGAAELSFVAWGGPSGGLEAFPGVDLDVRAGEVWARSPYLADGYVPGDPPGALRTDGRGFATVGDRGRWDGGALVVTGRGDDAVTTGGATVLVADVEAALQPAATGALAVVGLPHPTLGEVVAVVLTEGDDLEAAHRAALALDAAQRPRLWFARPTLPLTASGKTDRARLRREGAADGLRRLVPQRRPVAGRRA